MIEGGEIWTIGDNLAARAPHDAPGIRNFRVLITTTSEERVGHLAEACQSLSGGGSGLFLFTDRERLGRGDILAHYWADGPGELVKLASTNGDLV